MANNKKSSMAAKEEKVVMSNLKELEELLGVSRTFRKLEEILDDEFRFNSVNLKKRGEYAAYASCYKLAYANPDLLWDEKNRLERLARVMIAHNIGYVITNMLQSYTKTQEYITCGHYDEGVTFRNSGTISATRIA